MALPAYDTLFSGPVQVSEGRGVRVLDGTTVTSAAGDIWLAFGEFGFRGSLWFHGTERPTVETCSGEPGNLSSSPIGTTPLTLVTNWWSCIQLGNGLVGAFRVGLVEDTYVFGYLETWIPLV